MIRTEGGCVTNAAGFKSTLESAQHESLKLETGNLPLVRLLVVSDFFDRCLDRVGGVEYAIGTVSEAAAVGIQVSEGRDCI